MGCAAPSSTAQPSAPNSDRGSACSGRPASDSTNEWAPEGVGASVAAVMHAYSSCDGDNPRQLRHTTRSRAASASHRGTLHPCPTPSVAVPVSLTLRSRSRCCLHARQTPGGVHPRFRASELWSADRSSTACNAGLRARRSRRRQWTRATLSHGPLTTVRHRGCTAP
jgi:hypothetical protein